LKDVKGQTGGLLTFPCQGGCSFKRIGDERLEKEGEGRGVGGFLIFGRDAEQRQ